jgi:hypothetical protein
MQFGVSLLTPEIIPMVASSCIDSMIFVERSDPCPFGELRRRWELPILLHHVINVPRSGSLAHLSDSLDKKTPTKPLSSFISIVASSNPAPALSSFSTLLHSAC